MKPDTLSGGFSLDSSVLLEMLTATPSGQLIVQGLLAGSITAYTSYLNLTEAEYVLCRKIGREQSRSKVASLIRSNFITLIEMEKVHALAAQIKCERALALGDCYSLATAQVVGSKALFAFREEELVKEIGRAQLPVEIGFLEDAVS